MRMNRRNVLIGVGAVVAGGGAALGTGAFSQVEADRSASIEVADDADAFLGLAVHGSRLDAEGNPVGNFVSYETVDGQEVIEFHFDGEGDGEGLNVDATTQFDDLISISNNGTNDVEVTITPVDNEGNEVDLGFNAYTSDGDLDEIGPGDSVDVGFEFDLTDDDADPENAENVNVIEISATTDD